MSNLYHATTDLHHDAEKHPFGMRMAAGTLSRQEWTDWLGAMNQLHIVLDTYLPPSLKRAHDIHMDQLMMLPLEPMYSMAAEKLVNSLVQPEMIGGLCYILSGANLRGGQVIKRTLEPLGFPCNHLSFDKHDAVFANDWLKRLREATEVAEGAQKAFQGVISIMDEIHLNGSK